MTFGIHLEGRPLGIWVNPHIAPSFKGSYGIFGWNGTIEFLEIVFILYF